MAFYLLHNYMDFIEKVVETMINKLINIFAPKYFKNNHKSFKPSIIGCYISVVLAAGLLSYFSINTPFHQLLNNSEVFT